MAAAASHCSRVVLTESSVLGETPREGDGALVPIHMTLLIKCHPRLADRCELLLIDMTDRDPWYSSQAESSDELIRQFLLSDEYPPTGFYG